jgi:glucokinase
LGHGGRAPDGPVGYGKAGSVEGFCSGGGIAQLAKRRLGRPFTARDLAQAARDGDAAALAVWEEVGDRLGRALAIAIDLLNLDCIVIGSIFARSESLLRPAMARALREECLPAALAVCVVRPAILGDQLGDVAALTVAQNGLARFAP